MGHTTSKSRALDARYVSELSRYDIRRNPRMHPNIQSSQRSFPANKTGLAHRSSSTDWMSMSSPQRKYKNPSDVSGRPQQKLEKMETFPSFYQQQQMISAYYRNPASIQRQKTRSSPRRQPHGYNTFDVTKSSVMDRQQEEESSFKQLYENVMADKENMHYSAARRFTATLPHSYTTGSKSQHEFEEVSKHNYQMDSSREYDFQAPPGGNRVIPQHFSGRLPTFPAVYSSEEGMKKKAYSYNELNDYGIDGFQIAGDDKNDSRSSVVTTSRDTSPEAIRKVKAFPSNNSLTKVEDKPTNLLKKQHSTGSSRIQFSADQTERQRDRGSHLSRDKDRSSITFRDNPSREKNRSMSQSTSEESDFSDHYRRRRRDARSRPDVTSTGNRRNLYSASSKQSFEKTMDRRRHRRQNMSDSPDSGKDFSHSLKFRSSGPNDLDWGNRSTDEAQKELQSSHSQRREQTRTGTLQRKSRRAIANSQLAEDIFSSDEASSSAETQNKKFVSSGGVFDQPRTLTQQAAERHEKRNKAKLTRSATDFGEQSWRQAALLPGNIENMIKTLSKEEHEQKSQKQQKKKRRQKTTSQDTASAMGNQDLEKVIENQLAAALTSIMKQSK